MKIFKYYYLTFSEFKDNFNIQYNHTTKKWIVQVKKLLNDDQKSKDLAATMVAVKKGETVSGKAVLVLKYNDDEGSPEFSNSAYTGVYKLDDKDNFVVSLDEKIVVKPNNDKVKVTLVKTGMHKKFQIAF